MPTQRQRRSVVRPAHERVHLAGYTQLDERYRGQRIEQVAEDETGDGRRQPAPDSASFAGGGHGGTPLAFPRSLPGCRLGRLLTTATGAPRKASAFSSSGISVQRAALCAAFTSYI